MALPPGPRGNAQGHVVPTLPMRLLKVASRLCRPKSPPPSGRRQLLLEASEWVRFPFSEARGCHSPAGSPPRGVGRSSRGASLTCLCALRGVRREEGMSNFQSPPLFPLPAWRRGMLPGQMGTQRTRSCLGLALLGLPRSAGRHGGPAGSPHSLFQLFALDLLGVESEVCVWGGGGRRSPGGSFPTRAAQRGADWRPGSKTPPRVLWVSSVVDCQASTRGSPSSPAGLCSTRAFSCPEGLPRGICLEKGLFPLRKSISPVKIQNPGRYPRRSGAYKEERQQ